MTAFGVWRGMRNLSLLIACLGVLAPAATQARARVDVSGKPQTGVASYYSSHDAGRTTASGTKLAPNHMTAASPTLPLGTKAKVTNAKTGKSVEVTVTDRGPYAKHRILDVTPKAARKLGMKHHGVARVKVQPLHAPHRD